MAIPAASVISALATARKAAQLYPTTHPAHGDALEVLVDVVREAGAGSPLTINLHQGRLYHGSTVLAEDVPGSSGIAVAFESRHIESLTVAPGFGVTDATGLVEVLSLRPSQMLNVTEELAARGVTSVTVALLHDDTAEEREELDRRRAMDRALYQQLLRMLRQLVASLAAESRAGLGPAAGAVSDVVGRLAEDPAAVLALTWMRDAGDELLAHSVNVAIYAVTLGRELGLPEEGLASLGLSALLHDVGKRAFDANDPQQAESVAALHSQAGADILSRANHDDSAPMLVAYEHHMYLDGSGVPPRAEGYVAHPYSRMVAIADRYENLTNPHDPIEALTPDQAVVRVLKEAGSRLDPLFARLFAGALGVFPVGCMVRLTDDTVGVVCGPGSNLFAPVVRRTYDEIGLDLEEPEEVDLGGCDLDIAEVVDPASLNVLVADKL